MSRRSVLLAPQRFDYKGISQGAIWGLTESLKATTLVIESQYGEEVDVPMKHTGGLRHRRRGDTTGNSMAYLQEGVRGSDTTSLGVSEQAYVDRAHLQTRNCTYSDIQDPEPNMYSALQAVEAASHSSVEQQLYKELTLHLGRLLEASSETPRSLRDELTDFTIHDLPEIEKVLKGGNSVCLKNLKAHWRQIELLADETHDAFLQEGGLLLSRLQAETDPLLDFWASVEGLETCLEELTRDESLSCEAKSALQTLEDTLAQSGSAIEGTLRDTMGEDRRAEVLEAQYQMIRGCMETVLSCINISTYRIRLRRQCYRCLMSLQECLLPPFTIPEIATLASSLRSIAPSIKDSKFFDKLFNFIYTTLREADTCIQEPEVKERILASWNEIMSQHKQNFTPLTLAILRAQGETMVSRVTKAEGWLCSLVTSVSDFVDKMRGATRYESVDELVDAQKDPQARGQNSNTASNIIASVNSTLAAVINSFLQSIEMDISDVPLTDEQQKAFQHLSHLEMHIVNHLRLNCKGATRDKLERTIKKLFIDRVNLLWPTITDGLDPKALEVLNITRMNTFTILNKTSILRSLLQSVGKLTSNPEIISIISLVLLSSFVNGVEGAVAAHTSPYVLEKVTQEVWDKFVCPLLRHGYNIFSFWTPKQPSGDIPEPYEPYLCVNGNLNGTDRALDIWRDFCPQDADPSATEIFDCLERSPCTSETHVRGSVDADSFKFESALYSAQHPLFKEDLDVVCKESWLKTPMDFKDSIGLRYCRLGREGDETKWKIQVSNRLRVNNQSEGFFTYCATNRSTVEDIVKQYHGTLDEAQLAQLHCLRYIIPLTKDREILPKIPPHLLMKEATLEYDDSVDMLKVQSGDDGESVNCTNLERLQPEPMNYTNLERLQPLSPGEVPWISKLSTAIWGDNVSSTTATLLPYFAGASVLTLIAGGIYYYHKYPEHRTPTCFQALLDDPGLISDCLPLSNGRRDNRQVPETLAGGPEEGISLREVTERSAIAIPLMETPLTQKSTTEASLEEAPLVTTQGGTTHSISDRNTSPAP